jgi:hypothetical protein
MVGDILEANGNRVYIRSQEGDYISTREHFIFSENAHVCLISGMPVVFDVGQSSKGRVRAENVRIVDWLYPSPHQVELTVINYSNDFGTASMACGCHVKLCRDQFLADFKYVDDPNVVKMGAKLVADIRPYTINGLPKLKGMNIDILGFDQFKDSVEPPPQTPQQKTQRTLKQIIADEHAAKSKS